MSREHIHHRLSTEMSGAMFTASAVSVRTGMRRALSRHQAGLDWVLWSAVSESFIRRPMKRVHLIDRCGGGVVRKLQHRIEQECWRRDALKHCGTPRRRLMSMIHRRESESSCAA